MGTRVAAGGGDRDQLAVRRQFEHRFGGYLAHWGGLGGREPQQKGGNRLRRPSGAR
jgi:hypothetical protein